MSPYLLKRGFMSTSTVAHTTTVMAGHVCVVTTPQNICTTGWRRKYRIISIHCV